MQQTRLLLHGRDLVVQTFQDVEDIIADLDQALLYV